MKKHGYDDAGAPAGPTHGDKSIDYIFTSDGLDHSGAEIVPGDHPDIPGDDDHLSDHDGIVLELDPDSGGDPTENDPLEGESEATWRLLSKTFPGLF